MSGRFLSKEVRHDCATPKLREMRKQRIHEAEWQCASCGQVWRYMDTWAGDMWSRK